MNILIDILHDPGQLIAFDDNSSNIAKPHYCIIKIHVVKFAVIRLSSNNIKSIITMKLFETNTMTPNIIYHNCYIKI